MFKWFFILVNCEFKLIFCLFILKHFLYTLDLFIMIVMFHPIIQFHPHLLIVFVNWTVFIQSIFINLSPKCQRIMFKIIPITKVHYYLYLEPRC